MQQLLVTGGTGFIGRPLLSLLTQRELSVRLVTRQARCTSTHVTEVFKVSRFDEATNWSKVLQGMDCVIHLAARAHILQDSEPNPVAEFYRVNTAATTNLVRQAIAAGVRHFIFISSIGAVASSSKTDLTENTVCQPDTPYGRSKLAAEKALIELASGSSMAWTILRPTLVYGAGNPGNMERLFRLIETNLPLPFGLIQNQRSFVYVENLVDAIATCINNPKAFNQVFQVSDGHPLSTPQLVRLIAASAERHCLLLPVPMPLLKSIGKLGDGLEQLLGHQLPVNSQTVEKLTSSLVVKNDKICHTLDWTPPFTVETGLHKTFQKL